MKALILIFLVVFATNASAAVTKVRCSSERSIQAGFSHIATNAELSFELERKNNKSVITNLLGHIFVQSPFEQSGDFNTENSYMGFFKTTRLSANGEYNPRKYVGFAQFNDFDAAHTTGLEDGMFGYLALDVDPDKNEFNAFYVFQAGDHMGGTVLFTCRSR